MDPVAGAAYLVNGCMSCPELLSSVLKNFSSDELIELSSLNKLSKLEARRIIKARGDLIATTKESNTCEDLEDFAIGLELMRIMPFAGMNIKLGGQHECSRQALPGHELTVVCEEVLDRIDWNILKVQFLSDWKEHQDCPGFVLLKKILQMTRQVLQEFSLLVAQNQRSFLQNVLQDYTFSNLSTLKFRDVDVYTLSQEYTNFIKQLVSRAPNLQTLHTEGLVDLNANLLQGLPEGSQAVHVTGYPYSSSFLGEIPANVVRSLRLKEIRLMDTNMVLPPNGFDTITLNVLEASRTTLVGMQMDLPFLGPLMTHELSFVSVKKLKINLAKRSDWEFLYYLICNTGGSFGFNNLFPSLDTVQVHAVAFAVQNCFEKWVVASRPGNRLALLPEGVPLAQQAEHIKNLEVNVDSELRRRTADILTQMFPNVQRLSIRAKARVHFDEIWRSWPQLKELDVTIEPCNVIMANDPSPSVELDGVFCGIHPEEVAELRKQDDDYLRKVHIVPVKKSIASLENLRTLTIFLESTRSDLRINPSIYFSRVTPLIAFKKCPNLQVTIRTDDEDIDEALSHLKDYVPVVLDNLNLN